MLIVIETQMMIFVCVREGVWKYSKKPYSHICCKVHPVPRVDMKREIMCQPQNAHLRLSKFLTCLFASPAYQIRPHSVTLRGKCSHVCMHTMAEGEKKNREGDNSKLQWECTRVHAWMWEASRLIWQIESGSCLFLALWVCSIKGISLIP